MAKFFVGQKVRLVRAQYEKNLGAEGVITHMGPWGEGELLPIGLTLVGGTTDVIVNWTRPLKYTTGVLKHGPCLSINLEPILPEGAQPLGYSFEQMMSEFGVTEAMK